MTDFRSLNSLRRCVVQCRACPRLVAWREKVAREKVRRFQDQRYWGRPVPGFGDPEARLLVVGLAPAAHGGNRTGRIFTGDESGNWLYRALYETGFASQPHSISTDDGMRLNDCYISAVARCAPPANKPAPDEIANCSVYLLNELRLLKNLRVIVALGQIAFLNILRACERAWISPAPLRARFGHAATLDLPGDRLLIASYHPSQQNTFTGKLTREMLRAIFEQARRSLS